MREIKFRGKRYGDGAWVYGSLYQGTKEGEKYSVILNDSGYHLAPPDDRNLAIAFAENEVNVVIPETIGQFTGLLDKNGKDIYEGDILLLPANTKVKAYEKCDFVEDKFVQRFAVVWAKQCQGYGLCQPYEAKFEAPDVVGMAAVDRMFVIGNIHDNPELLNK